MKAIIMAAGIGTRMLPLTKDIPKVLIPINGKPFLHYVIENLKKAGYDEFGIVAGYKHQKIEEFVKKNNINAKIILQENPKGTGHAVMQARDFCGDNDFIVLGGDSLFSCEDLRQINKKDNFCYIVGKETKQPEKYGILVLDDEVLENDIDEDLYLKKIVEKPKEYVGDLASVGLYKFTKEIWQALSNIKLSMRGEYELTDAISILAEQKKVKVLKLLSYWVDFGSIEDIPVVDNFLRIEYTIKNKANKQNKKEINFFLN